MNRWKPALLLFVVAAGLASLPAAAEPPAAALAPSPSLSAPAADVEAALGLTPLATSRPDAPCDYQTRWVPNGCGGCYKKTRMEEESRTCCGPNCSAWQRTGNWTCNYVCL